MKLETKARRHVQAMLGQVERRANEMRIAPADAISKSLLEVARHRYLSSVDAKAHHLQWLNGRNRNGTFKPQPFADALATAKNLDLFEPYDGELRFDEIRNKISGKLRRVVSLTPPLKMAHRMAKQLIQAQFNPASHIYNWKGKGSAKMLHDMVAAFELGHSYLLLADVKNCYDSIDFQAIYDLNLFPSDFIAAQLDLRTKKLRRNACEHLAGELDKEYKVCPLCTLASSSEPDGLAQYRISLVQGSPASNAILAVLFDDLPDHLPPDILCFIYSDNIALIAKDIEVLVAAKEALVSYYSHHDAGRLSLTFSFEGDARAGFEHVGYRVELCNGSWSVGHSDANFYRTMQRIVARFPVNAGAEQYCGQEYDVTRDDALSVFKEFTSGFPALSADRRGDVFKFLLDEEFNVLG